MKNAPNITPLASLPEYKQAFDKLQRFQSEMAKAQAETQRLEALRLQSGKEAPVLDSIDAAEALLSGGGQTQSLAEQVTANERVKVALKKAIEAQQAIVDRIAGEASNKVGQQLKDEHRKRVAQVVEALEALVQANAREMEIHQTVAQMGYIDTLPPLRFTPPACAIDPTDRNGGYCPTWWSDAALYVGNGTTPMEAWGAKCASEQASKDAQTKAKQEAQQAERERLAAEERDIYSVGIEKFHRWAATHK